MPSLFTIYIIMKKDNVAYDLPSLAISGATGVGDERRYRSPRWRCRVMIDRHRHRPRPTWRWRWRYGVPSPSIDRCGTLTRMALDLLTVPPMSAECERLFSTTGHMVTKSRNRLDASTIGLCQTLRSWLRAGLISSLDRILMEQ